MINQILIENIALIDELSIDFNKGFNVLTGETGAGKSIIIDSVNLALGERADRELIQSGKDFARVELLFTVSESSPIKGVLEKYNIEFEPDNSLLIMRKLTTQGKNLCQINGRTVTLTMLRNITQHLVDIHGQHQHQYLLNSDTHISFLDQYCKTELSIEKTLLKEMYHNWKNLEKEIKRIKGIGKDGVRHMDILQYQINEIVEAELMPGEEEGLVKERDLLLNAEKIISSVNDAYINLYTGSLENSSITDRLARIISELHSVQNMDKSLDTIISQLESTQYTIEDATTRLRDYKDGFDHNPHRLENIENRLQLIKSLKRKYGDSIEEILEFSAELNKEYKLLRDSQERLEELEKKCSSLLSNILKQCKKVSIIRNKNAKDIEKEIISHLSDLNMHRTEFKVSINTPDLKDNNIKNFITENGFDSVEFLISPNPGEPLKPLAKIISGGEMSRVMLALKTLLGDIDKVPTMIFDEIDVGISGQTAQRVAEKIGAISKGHQVISVTHLAQIASMADTHFAIQKKVNDNHTSIVVTRLSHKERVKEIARMLGGANITKLSLEHAEELIKSAKTFKN